MTAEGGAAPPGFRLEVPERFNFSRDVVDRWARDPERRALWWIDDEGGEQQWTFAQLAEESRRVANALAGAGVRRGDVVLLILPRIVEWWMINLACHRIGAVVSPGTIQLSAKDLAYRIEAAEATCIITSAGVAARVDEALESLTASERPVRIIAGAERSGWLSLSELQATASTDFETANTRSDEAAILYFTSGTTGGPKMTLHTHASYPLGNLITGRFWLNLSEHDVHWNISDLGWAKAGWSSLYGPWHMGATVFVHQTDRFEPKRALDILSRYPVTSVCAAPTILRLLVLEDLSRYEFPSLRSCVTAGEPLNPETFHSWRNATGVTIREGYGQTETVILVGTFADVAPSPGSMGVVSPGFDVRVVDEGGQILPPFQEGDLAVRVRPERPVGLFKEYWKEPERTARYFKGDWYLTGDRAVEDEDGYLYFVGRADDVILSAAYRIGPFEVESALLEHEAVAESAVVASPDEIRGSVVKAFIVLAPGFEPSEELARRLQEHVKRLTAPYKYPRKVEFVNDLPKTVSGKIRRAELRERELKA
jgi:acetyl-CoA synthetase/medium-chain acyl-CoA synthetase